MTEITKTIQIYKPEEKLPEPGKYFIATIKGFSFNEMNETFYAPDNNVFGDFNIETRNYSIVDSEGTSTLFNAEQFKENIIEWYYIPYSS